MSRLSELIRDLCPDGVEYRPLGRVAALERGTPITKKQIATGDIPVIAGGREPAYSHNVANREGETLVVAGSGAYAGYVSYWDRPVFVSDAFSIKVDGTVLLPRFVYHWMAGSQNKIHSFKSGGGVPHVYAKDVAKLLCPIPPLEVQREIVRVLDQFTALEAELEAELEARHKQYEYYRVQLMRESSAGDVAFKTLEELFVTRNGYTPRKNDASAWESSDVPWFRMEDIRENGGILSEAQTCVSSSAVKGGRVFPANSILVATSATIGAHALITVPHLSNQRFTSLQLKEEYRGAFDHKFLYYYCFLLDEHCLKNAHVSSFASVEMKAFKSFKFPVVPLEVQWEIVRVLDRFTALEAELEAELEGRRKQYEHYRDRLLSFSERGI